MTTANVPTTTRQGRVLIVEDLQEWRDTLTAILQKAGFFAEAVSSAEEALLCLDTSLYHLVILDISLHGTTVDNAGEQLLHTLGQLGLTEAIKVIMLSAYGTKEQMRSAFRDYQVADFLSKNDFNQLVFVENVRAVFTTIHINLRLNIIWQQNIKPEQAVLNLEMDGVRVERGSALSRLMVQELEDLLCRLFHDAERILVKPLMSTPSRSGAGVLWVQPFYAAGAGHAFVVKFGPTGKIRAEERCFKECVRPFIAGARSTTIITEGRTPRLGGIVYSLLGAANDHWVDFAHFYAHHSSSEVKDALNRLFQDTCSAWYANPGHLFPQNLSNEYSQSLGCSLEQLEQVVAQQLPSAQIHNGKLSFNALAPRQSFSDPFLTAREQEFVYTTYETITHGDLNQHNILVDDANYMWLVDFEGTGSSHILRDVATLDAVVRFQLLAAHEATLEERLVLEHALGNVKRFRQVDLLLGQYQAPNAALAHAYATVVHLRCLAFWLVDQNPDDNIGEYYVALFFHALNTLQFSSLQPVQREHALLSASLLADALESKQ